LKINLTSNYNHEKFKANVAEGSKIVNNTNFTKYEQERLHAIKQFKINDIVETNGYSLIITDIAHDNLICSLTTPKGRIKKNTSRFVNTCHCIINNK